MGTAKYHDTKIYHNLKPWDVNRTDINSWEDRRQDKELERLEIAKKPKRRKKGKRTG
jgi:hypothetical protein